MKIFFMFACLPLYFQLVICVHKDLESEWQAWKVTYKRQYTRMNEEQKRATWESNYKMIQQNNQHVQRGRKTITMGMNKFGDLTSEEFTVMLGLFQKNTGRAAVLSAEQLRTTASKLNLNSIDYRTKGYITPVKEQGECGSCWAFTAAGALEGQMFKKTGKLVSLSVQNLIDCSRPQGNYGCLGGLMDGAYKYMLASNGIQSEASYPYRIQDDLPCSFNSSKVVAKITGYNYLPFYNEQALADAVAVFGPISVGIDASLLQFYQSGRIFNDPKCSSEKINHAVLVVGYGSVASQKYWIIKNSWSASWGEEGYFRLAKDMNRTCGISNYSVVPTV
ncbi:cathepsin L1-like [Acipenser oxyrinchus oxyrinchus]|uniref:Cathepsin L1-like n=1 Tax=Acipenser oxyrinchus oxyrinchus TaxID=40147 RepID=A0AAD8G9U1_ACIOX|nr:cathepsin L1-like [Acipenser oxyrinchus oxyrinchus]